MNQSITPMIPKVLIVCLGNICRSPTAEAVLRTKAREQHIDLVVDSAGTISYHQGCLPDDRARRTAGLRGYSFSGIISRPICEKDFTDFDIILAADNSNLKDLKAQCPEHLHYKIALFLSYGQSQVNEIPDPYYGGDDGFDDVINLIEESADNILKKLAKY